VMAINVEAAYPERRDMDEVIEVNGNLEPVVHVEIFARQSGLIEEIFKEEGDRVEKDDLLAKVDDDEIRLSYEQARLAYQVAREKYQRYKGLFQKNMVSTQEFEDIERAYNDAKVNMDSARLRLEYTDITTPVSGTVVERMCEPQQLVGTMEKVFAVAQLHQFKIPIFITEAEIGKIEENQDVRIRVDALNPDPAVYPYTGYIDHISPRINPSNGMVEVRVMLKNPGELKMGMFCRLKIITARRTDALVIPKKALMGEEINQVWVVDGDRGQLREVVTGIRDDKYVEILSGIKPEEMVITEGQTALTEKSRIRIVNMQDEALEKHGEEPL
jgi:membrane fusion protein (multidrug efflux system)